MSISEQINDDENISMRSIMNFLISIYKEDEIK